MDIFIKPMALILGAIVVILMSIFTGWAHLEGLLNILNEGAFLVEIEMEEDIAVLLVAFGVWLEELPLFTNLFGKKQTEVIKNKVSELGEVFGAYLLLIGLFMETNDLCFEPVLAKFGFAHIGLGIMVFLDVLAIFVCFLYLIKMHNLKRIRAW